jgi:cytochrome c-type biogenesis protein CcmH
MAGARLVPSAARLMGWVALALVGAAAAGLLRLIGLPRGLWAFVGAALMLGAAGYALQGEPLLPGHAVKADADPIQVDPAMLALRDDMVGRFRADTAYLIASDAMLRSGDTGNAAKAVIGGLHHYPSSMALWTGLGTVLATHDGGRVSPAALFAFSRAMRLAPEHPAPFFFAGLAYVRAGEFAKARPYWARALAVTPEGVSYHGAIAERLELLDRFLAVEAAQ